MAFVADGEYLNCASCGETTTHRIYTTSAKCLDCGKRTPRAKLTSARYAPANPCTKHAAFEADNCPGCGTADRIA